MKDMFLERMSKVKKYVEKNPETAGETHLVNIGIYKLYLMI